MPISAPVYRLKRRAKLISRDKTIPLHAALDHVAHLEGYRSWSQLSAVATAASPDMTLQKATSPGKIMLLGARPGQGKTLTGMRLLVDAMGEGRHGVFFSLDYTALDVAERFRALKVDPSTLSGLFSFHDSDAINADYIMEAMDRLPEGALAVIDYLQLLDQRRDNPELEEQVRSLRDFARRRNMTMILISQIDRRFELTGRDMPELQDIRLPNALDLTLFDVFCFLNAGQMRLSAVS